MRPGQTGQNRRVRGRTNRKGPNPLTRSFESNGPDVKIRGTAQHIAEKYTQLARDAQVAGDPVASENHLQHAEHYFRLIAAAQAQYQQTYGVLPRSFEDGDEGEGDDDYGHDAPSAPRMPQANVGDDAYPVGIPQPGQSAPGGYRERQDRPERQDRFERPQRNERYDRQDRPERQDRAARPERQPRANAEYNNDSQPRHEAPRNEAPRREGPRNEAPRQEGFRQEGPRQEARQDGPRQEGDREPRGGRRERFRRDRDVRPAPRDADVAGDEFEVAGGLPAFLTTPVRPAAPAVAPAPVEAVIEDRAPAEDRAPDRAPAMDMASGMASDVDRGSAVVQVQDETNGEDGGDRFPVRARRRRGRPRADADGATDATDAEQSAAG